MKVIDKTPLQNDKGQIGAMQRLQGTLEFGRAWYAELEAQKAIVTQLDSVLEKGFTLIRNVTLGRSQITVPLALIGPPGVYVIYVTTLSGFYEAKGGEWSQVKSGRAFPDDRNPMMRVTRLARALQVFLERQGITLPGSVEPVLMSSSPALHIETQRPMVRVVLSDAVRQFGASLLQARPVLRPDLVSDIADRVITPRAKAEPPPSEAPELSPTYVQTVDEVAAPARARAIFHAAEESGPFDPANLNFDYDETAENEVPENLKETSPSQRLPAAGRRGGLSRGQFFVLGAMVLVECCVLASFAYLIFTGSR